MTDSYQITYDELPSFPVQCISFEPEVFSLAPNVISPKRKQRRCSQGSAKKQKQATRGGLVRALPSVHEAQGSDGPRIQSGAEVLAGSYPPDGPSEYERNDTSSNSGQIRSAGGTSDDQQSPYESFVEAISSGDCDFWQISKTLFVVSGWNFEANHATNTLYHLRMSIVGQKRHCHCLCPEARHVDECFHIRFLRHEGRERFPADDQMIDEEDKSYLLFRNLELLEPISYRNVFSVPTPGALVTIKNRAIVEHFGGDSGSGTWTCSKDAKVPSCSHIKRARDCLQQHIQLDESARDVNAENPQVTSSFSFRSAREDVPAVSYKGIPPPLWARISTDPVDLAKIPPLIEPPSLLKLDATSACPCRPESRSMYTKTGAKKIQRCEVYGMTRMWNCDIEVQKCPSCQHRFIGPDCQGLGLFNWNNRVLLSLDLLDDYTSSFSSSETPFAAWVAVLGRRYEMFQSPSPFLSEKRFRVIWFAYARLLELNDDMRCPKCGPTPKVTIWDGVTLAFSRKNLKPSLCPPTTIHPHSKIRINACHPDKPQCIQEPELRKRIRRVLSGPPLRWIYDEETLESLVTVDDNPSDDDTEELAEVKRAARMSAAKQKALEDMRSRIDLVQGVIEELCELDYSVGNLFNRCYGLRALISNSVCPPVYTRLFKQIASEEWATQLMTRSVVHNIKLFVDNPNSYNASFLNMFPALHAAAILELSNPAFETVSDDLLGLCEWIMMRGMTVFLSSKKHEGGEKDALGATSSSDWQKTGCYYSMPQIRYRPRYPEIPQDGKTDTGGQAKRGGCGKYYSEYSQKRLTGGIMVVWCTHTVCYGFHCIPNSEGRNEVFSAIYTHWEKAPDIIVYDYACNLASYIMAREPAFFADTKCVIDHFHSMGHKSCSDACKLLTYVTTNPDLDKINSSAAESGNSGILRIRKSVSYMTQDHAIIYTKVFLSIRNRLIIRKQERRK